MTYTSHRLRTLGFGLIAIGIATTSVGVARGSGTDDPGPSETSLATQWCGTYERRLLPRGSVLMFEPCPIAESPRCPGG